MCLTNEVDIEKNLSAWWEYAIWGDRVVITLNLSRANSVKMRLVKLVFLLNLVVCDFDTNDPFLECL